MSETSAGTGYVGLAACKAELRITDTSHDTEITTAIVDASNYIDTLIMPYVPSVPLSSPYPVGIVTPCKFFSCSIYLRMMPASEVARYQADTYWTMAQTMIDNFIVAMYFKKTLLTLPLPPQLLELMKLLKAGGE